MKEMNLDRLTSLANIASTVSSIGTTEARRVAGKLLDLVEADAAGQTVTSVDTHQWTAEEAEAILAKYRDKAIGMTNTAEPAVSVGESRLYALEQAEQDLRRLVALIGLHDGAVAIQAQTTISALSVEIGELIAKHKA